MLLNCHTHFSLKYGILSPRQLLEEAQAKGWKRFVLTDINNTSAGLDVLRMAPEYGIEPLLGIDFRNGAQQVFVGIAQNNQGWQELNDYLSQFLDGDQKEIPARAPNFHNSFVVYPIQSEVDFELKSHEFIGISIAELRHHPFSRWKGMEEKMVVLNPVTFRNKSDFNAHRLLRAIDCNSLLSRLPKSEEGNPQAIMPLETEIEDAFAAYPQILANTRQLLNSCTIHFDFGPDFGHRNQKCYLENEEQDIALLRKLAYDGLEYRYGQSPELEVIERIERELTTIKEKGFVSYFLISWDIVSYAQSKGYFYVGRGSGANSIISFLLRITDVDPIQLNLYFERFINLFRRNPPDFDIDFSWKDRDDVTRYIFNRFPHVALCGAYVTFQRRSVIRELGKVFGLPSEEIVRLQKEMTAKDRNTQLILHYSDLIHGFPSHLSPHSAGILISEKPLHIYTATYLPPKGFSTVHFDMIIAEDVGLYKWDILGQRGLAKIKDSLSIIETNKPDAKFDIHDVRSFYANAKCNALLAAGKAIGCFYIESPAMRMLLTKLRVNDYLGLVAASSVIRPGVAQSGMMQQYILRHRYPEKRREAHPTLLEIMPETYGVMVYQEDVIKVAHYYAGLNPSQADVLRRGMSGKFRGREEFFQVREQFFLNCEKMGRDNASTQDIWRQIESFAGYAFAKGHSASYAVESYQCLFLKAYFPLEYMVATINNGGGFYSQQIYLHEARMHGANVELPCVNLSFSEFTIRGSTIHIGLAFINGIDTAMLDALIEERTANGAFADLRDVVERVPISLDQLLLLIRSGAFRFTQKDKKTLLWDAHFLLGKGKKVQSESNLFRVKPQEFVLPNLWYHELENAYDEIELLGYPVTVSPFDLVDCSGQPTLKANQLAENVGKVVAILGYRVHVKQTSTKQREKMHFGTLIDLEGNWIDTVHFPKAAAQFPFRGPGVYKLRGKVTEEFGHISLMVEQLERLPNLDLGSTNTRLSEKNTSKQRQ